MWCQAFNLNETLFHRNARLICVGRIYRRRHLRRHKQYYVINVTNTCGNWLQDNGAAYEAGGLEVGQLILEVDGQKVEGNASKDKM